MALNLKRAGVKNKADEMIEQMNSSSADFVNQLANISKVSDAEAKPVITMPAEKDILPVSEPAAANAPDAVKSETPVTENITSNEPDPGIDIDINLAKTDIERYNRKEEIVKAASTHTSSGRRGRKPKSECGETCRVQFSSTLTPDLLDRIKSEAKVQGIPLSCFIERVFTEYFNRK